MPRRTSPHQFNAKHCDHCGAIVVLYPHGAIVYDTVLRCIACGSIVKLLRMVDNEQAQQSALAPA